MKLKLSRSERGYPQVHSLMVLSIQPIGLVGPVGKLSHGAGKNGGNQSIEMSYHGHSAQ